MMGYLDKIKRLNRMYGVSPRESNVVWNVTDRVPADAGPVCEQRMRISRRVGEKTLANDMIRQYRTRGNQIA